MAVPAFYGGWRSAPNALWQHQKKFGVKSKFKRKSQLGKPKRPVTGYDIFFRNTLIELKNRRPDMPARKIFGEVARMWREETTWIDRQICYDFAVDESYEYDKAMKEWKSSRAEMREKDRNAKAALLQKLQNSAGNGEKNDGGRRGGTPVGEAKQADDGNQRRFSNETHEKDDRKSGKSQNCATQ